MLEDEDDVNLGPISRYMLAEAKCLMLELRIAELEGEIAELRNQARQQ